MTAQTLYRFRCDAPQCVETAIGESLADLPSGWRRLGSTEHIDNSPLPTQRRANAPSHSERCIGEFWLHLCESHHNAFDEHLPRTDGHRRSRGREATLSVYCSCGARLGWTPAVHILAGGGNGPSRSGERLWWSHLPADLQWYAVREEARSDV